MSKLTKLDYWLIGYVIAAVLGIVASMWIVIHFMKKAMGV